MFDTTSTYEILIYEQDYIVRESLKYLLKDLGYQVTATGNGKDALSSIKHHTFDFLITACKGPFYSGLEIVSHLRDQQQAPTRVFVLTETTAKDELLAHYKVERAFAKPLDLEAIEKTFGNMKTQSDEYLVAS